MDPRPDQASRDVIDGKTIWRKRHGREERRFLKWLLRQHCRILRVPALLPAYSQSAAEKCRTELAQIHRLAELGVLVPEVVFSGEGELGLSDIGPTLAQLCRATTDINERERLIRLGFDAILDLHQRGGNVSQAFARNMTLCGKRVGFIDLEEDPLTVMTLPAAQARDVLFYVSATARFLVSEPQRYAELLAGHLAQAEAPVRDEIVRAARRLSWVCPVAGLCGARGRALRMALSQLRRSTPIPDLAALLWMVLPYAPVQTLLV